MTKVETEPCNKLNSFCIKAVNTLVNGLIKRKKSFKNITFGIPNLT